MDKNFYKTFIFLSILPLIYVSTTLETALITGFILVVVGVAVKASSLVIEKYATPKIAVYSYVLLSATVVSVLSIILGTYMKLDAHISVYLSLLLLSIGVVGYKDIKLSFTVHSVLIVIAFGVLISLGFLREFLGTGALNVFGSSAQIFDAKYALGFLKDPSGGYILAGLIFALISAIQFRKKEEVNHVV